MIGLLKTEVNFDGTTQKFVTSLLKKNVYIFLQLKLVQNSND